MPILFQLSACPAVREKVEQRSTESAQKRNYRENEANARSYELRSESCSRIRSSFVPSPRVTAKIPSIQRYHSTTRNNGERQNVE